MFMCATCSITRPNLLDPAPPAALPPERQLSVMHILHAAENPNFAELRMSVPETVPTRGSAPVKALAPGLAEKQDLQPDNPDIPL
jgi:hypothetical protein